MKGTRYELIIQVIMGQQGVFSERMHSSCSNFAFDRKTERDDESHTWMSDCNLVYSLLKAYGIEYMYAGFLGFSDTVLTFLRPVLQRSVAILYHTETECPRRQLFHHYCDNLWCHQWWQSCHYDDSQFSTLKNRTAVCCSILAFDDAQYTM